jgi:hypothetical protein
MVMALTIAADQGMVTHGEGGSIPNMFGKIYEHISSAHPNHQSKIKRQLGISIGQKEKELLL